MSDSQMPDDFDRLIGQLDGLPDSVKTGQSTVRVIPPFGVGGVSTFIVQTYRQRDQGDTIFLEHMNGKGSLRLVIPAKVANTIANQRDALTGKSRRKAARATAADRKARGEVPGFKMSAEERKLRAKARAEKARKAGR